MLAYNIHSGFILNTNIVDAYYHFFYKAYHIYGHLILILCWLDFANKSFFLILKLFFFHEKFMTAVLLLLLTCKVTSDSLQPLELQHARLTCPSPSPRACSNSCPLSQ